jgi:hypothetical protein
MVSLSIVAARLRAIAEEVAPVSRPGPPASGFLLDGVGDRLSCGRPRPHKPASDYPIKWMGYYPITAAATTLKNTMITHHPNTAT